MRKKKTYTINKIYSPVFAGNVFSITQGSSTCIVDCSNPGDEQSILNGLKRNKIELGEVRLIILTHSHHDHSGSAAALRKAAKNSKLVIHKTEAKFLKEGQSQYPKGLGVIGNVVSFIGRSRMMKRFHTFHPVTPDIEMEGKKMELRKFGFDDEIYLLHTPGHSVGSISVVCGDHCFVGDTLFNRSIYHVCPPFCDDYETMVRSWKDLLDTKCKVFYPGHGAELSRREVLKVWKQHKKKLDRKIPPKKHEKDRK